MITQFDKNIWYVDRPFRFLGAEIGTRMTIIRLGGSDDLFIHSAIEPWDELVQEIKKLGTVRYIVAPNKWHHLFAQSFRDSFPGAKLFGAPGLELKRKDIAFDGTLDQNLQFDWSTDLAMVLVEGVPVFNEIIFFHKPSQTILVTDFGFHICENSPWLTRTVFKIIGTFKRYGWASIEKKIFIKDKELFSKSINKILNWDFEKILLTHGVPIKQEGKTKFKDAFYFS